jgi:hypothetical protein
MKYSIFTREVESYIINFYAIKKKKLYFIFINETKYKIDLNKFIDILLLIIDNQNKYTDIPKDIISLIDDNNIFGYIYFNKNKILSQKNIKIPFKKYIENIIKVFSLANIENIKLNYFIYSYFYLFFVKEINHNYNYSDSDEYDYYLDNFPSEEYLDYIDLNIID